MIINCSERGMYAEYVIKKCKDGRYSVDGNSFCSASALEYHIMGELILTMNMRASEALKQAERITDIIVNDLPIGAERIFTIG